MSIGYTGTDCGTLSYNPNVVDGKEHEYQEPESKPVWIQGTIDEIRIGYDCGEWTYPCKPASHAEHDVLCSDIHDAHYCYTCDAWVESVCDDMKCKMCKDRPEKMIRPKRDAF